jgi:hypothetical protein
MELTLSLAIIGKTLGFLFVSLFWAFMCLAPVNDQPTSRGQVIFWVSTEVFFFAWLFNFISFKVVS